MTQLSSLVYRGELVESKHEAICLLKDISNREIFSTHNKDMLVYPRSAIKIFQALPFINSAAHIVFDLCEESIAISCSSHCGEPLHIKILKVWLRKINISLDQLKCGIHNPLDEKSSNDLLLSGTMPSQLYNNCAGKHLGMISGCLANKMSIDNYLEFDHPYQQSIQESLENFMESKIQSKCISTDGCSAPQYAFPFDSIATSMVNLIKEKEKSNKYSNAINIILSAINKFPLLIGGHNRFDSEIIKTTKGRIFCKGGAEGVLLFADFKKKIGGAIKILDGNSRAIPSITMRIFIKFGLLTKNETKKLSYWTTQKLTNHKKKYVGKITAELL